MLGEMIDFNRISNAEGYGDGPCHGTISIMPMRTMKIRLAIVMMELCAVNQPTSPRLAEHTPA